jgi:hypothetical protein
VANSLGSGLLETPALLAFLPALCQYLLGEELRLPSAPSVVVRTILRTRTRPHSSGRYGHQTGTAQFTHGAYLWRRIESFATYCFGRSDSRRPAQITLDSNVSLWHPLLCWRKTASSRVT